MSATGREQGLIQEGKEREKSCHRKRKKFATEREKKVPQRERERKKVHDGSVAEERDGASGDEVKVTVSDDLVPLLSSLL